MDRVEQKPNNLTISNLSPLRELLAAREAYERLAKATDMLEKTQGERAYLPEHGVIVPVHRDAEGKPYVKAEDIRDPRRTGPPLPPAD